MGWSGVRKRRGLVYRVLGFSHLFVVVNGTRQVSGWLDLGWSSRLPEPVFPVSFSEGCLPPRAICPD